VKGHPLPIELGGKNMSVRKQRGLTLVELMVVVAVMAVLATIAYPLYTAQAQKGRRTEGRSALMELAQAQERFFTTNGRYASTLSSLNVDTNTEHNYYTISVVTGTASFIGTATPTAGGAQSSDSCTGMTINQLGVKAGTGSKCW
jgi:type IV pilus assembly protein PilE